MHFVPVLLLLACWYQTETRAFHKIPLTRREVKENAIALDQIARAVRRGVDRESLRMVNIDLFNFQNVQYFGTVYVGMPKQRFDVLFDTGSDVFWIPGPNDNDDCGLQHRKFFPVRSRTYQNLNKKIDMNYVKGSAVLNLANETLTIGGVTVQKQVIGLVESGVCEDQQFDGIMGMSFPYPQRPEITPVFETMINQNAVPAPVFSFYLNNKVSYGSKGGELYLGGWNPEYVTGPINYIPLLKEDTNNWAIQMKSIYFGSKLIAPFPKAILDTGTSLILGPAHYVDQILSVVEGIYLPNVDVVTVDCTLLDQLPSLTINIEKDYTFTSRDLLIQESDGLCFLGVGKYPNGSVLGDAWLLGDTFLSKVYSIHDYAHRKIALVPLRNNIPGTTESPLPPITDYPSGSFGTSASMVLVSLSVLCTFIYL